MPAPLPAGAQEFLRGESNLAKAAGVDVVRSTLPLDEIQDRAGGDTRKLDPEHTKELAETIAVLGLIEPLVVDNQNRLLAGGHRRAAIAQLREANPALYSKHFPNGVPVHKLDFDSEQNKDLGLRIEVAENEKRRDYSRAEVRALAERFKDAGYVVRGRPKEGQPPLIPALTAIVGKSRATIQRYLHEESPSKKISNETLKADYDLLLARAHKDLSKWIEKPRKTKREKEAVGKLNEALRTIQELLGGD